jgi:DNA gyrase/topoisomerase IV subunit B
MDAKVLASTTLDPRSRILLKVEIDSILDTDKDLVDLLGKDPAQRAMFIMESSEFADIEGLDV